MGTSSGRTNRGWLIVVGLLAIAAGTAAALVASGQFRRWFGPSALTGSDPVLTAGQLAAVGGQVLAVSAVALGVVLAVLVLLWLAAQVPRRNRAKALRLHGDALRGTTLCDAAALEDAVTGHLVELGQVSSASAVLRGTAGEPELTVQIVVDERADLQTVLNSIRTEVAGGLATALEVPLRLLRVGVDVSPARRTSRSVTL